MYLQLSLFSLLSCQKILSCQVSQQLIAELLVNLNTDSASVLRGPKTGAIRRIAAIAPMVLETDLGGDILHHLHNSVKTVLGIVFAEVLKFLDDTKLEITTSPRKEAAYLKCCSETGCHPVVLISWKFCRFLDWYRAIKDRKEHFPALIAYIEKVKCQPVSSPTISSEESDSEEDEDLAETARRKRGETERKRQGRIARLKKAVEEDRVETQMLLAQYCLKPLYELLVWFQSQAPLSHFLYDESSRIFMETLLEVVEPKYLKSQSGSKLSDEELKSLVLETEEERKLRRKEERRLKKKQEEEEEAKEVRKPKKNDHKEEGKKVKKKQEVDPNIRHATLKEVSEVLIPEEINNKILELKQSENLNPLEVAILKMIRQERIFMYNKMLVLEFQHYLHFDLSFTKAMKFLCPAKIDEKEAAQSIQFLASRLSGLVKPTQLDDLTREWNSLVLDKTVFDTKYEKYLEEVADKNVNKFKRTRIDEVWAPVIKNSNYPILSHLLKGLLSVFHGTAAVEGSVNNIRNTLGDRKHSLIDENLNSRAFCKSKVKASDSLCCFDYNYNTKEHRKNWEKASIKRNEVTPMKSDMNTKVMNSDPESENSDLDSPQDRDEDIAKTKPVLDKLVSPNELPDPENCKKDANRNSKIPYKIPRVQIEKSQEKRKETQDKSTVEKSKSKQPRISSSQEKRKQPQDKSTHEKSNNNQPRISSIFSAKPKGRDKIYGCDRE